MSSFWRRVFGTDATSCPRRAAAPGRPAGLRVEELEVRDCPAAAYFLFDQGRLIVSGDATPTRIEVSSLFSTGSNGTKWGSLNQLAVGAEGTEVRVNGAPIPIMIMNDPRSYYAARSVPRLMHLFDGRPTLVEVHGGNSDDMITVTSNVPASAPVAVLYGYGGNDYLRVAGAGVLYGGTGNDTLYGGASNDRLYGEADHDYLDGGAGNDLLEGGIGNDRLYGGVGDDTLYGGDGTDRLYGGTGADALYGGAGFDVLVAGGDPGDVARPDDPITTTSRPLLGTTLSLTENWASYAGAVQAVGMSPFGPDVLYLSGLPALDFGAMWAKAQPQVNTAVAEQIAARGISKARASFASTALVDASNARNDGTVQVRLRLLDNVVSGSHSGVDFAIKFHAEVTVTVTAVGGQVRLTDVRANVWGLQVDGTNLLGDLAIGLADIANFFGVFNLNQFVTNLVNSKAAQHLAPVLHGQFDTFTAALNAAVPVYMRPFLADLSVTFDTSIDQTTDPKRSVLTFVF